MSDTLVAIVGNDATIVNDAVHEEITTLLDGIDSSLALEDFTVRDATGGDEETSSVTTRVLEALNTPPFLVASRIVVLRDVQALGAEDTELLVAWTSSPTPGVKFLVSLTGSKTKSKLVKAADRVVDVAVGSRAKDRIEFVLGRFESHEMRISSSLAEQIAERVGDDVARVDSLARTLNSIYGASSLNFDQVAEYLGDAGDVPEWDLTDAIDQGKVAPAIETARRMLDSRGRAGVQVINILQRHYLKMARLDGSGAATGEAAAAIIGGHSYPAEKLVRAARVLGPDRIANAVKLIARADHDLKGGISFGGRNDDDVDQTDLTVVEVLVARLAKMSEAARRS